MDKETHPTHMILKREGCASFEINSELIGGVLTLAHRELQAETTQSNLLRIISREAERASCSVAELLLQTMVNYWVSLYEQTKNETAV